MFDSHRPRGGVTAASALPIWQPERSLRSRTLRGRATSKEPSRCRALLLRVEAISLPALSLDLVSAAQKEFRRVRDWDLQSSGLESWAEHLDGLEPLPQLTSDRH